MIRLTYKGDTDTYYAYGVDTYLIGMLRVWIIISVIFLTHEHWLSNNWSELKPVTVIILIRLCLAKKGMLRRMPNKSLWERIRNKKRSRNGRGSTESLIVIEDKMWENRLRWFRHNHRRSVDVVVRWSDMDTVEGSALTEGRSKLTSEVVARKDIFLGYHATWFPRQRSIEGADAWGH